MKNCHCLSQRADWSRFSNKFKSNIFEIIVPYLSHLYFALPMHTPVTNLWRYDWHLNKNLQFRWFTKHLFGIFKKFLHASKLISKYHLKIKYAFKNTRELRRRDTQAIKREGFYKFVTLLHSYLYGNTHKVIIFMRVTVNFLRIHIKGFPFYKITFCQVSDDFHTIHK